MLATDAGRPRSEEGVVALCSMPRHERSRLALNNWMLSAIAAIEEFALTLWVKSLELPFADITAQQACVEVLPVARRKRKIAASAFVCCLEEFRLGDGRNRNRPNPFGVSRTCRERP
jgi:hypothetical protein